jgi:hypothetical protein
MPTHLLLVPHGALATDHDLAAGLLLQLLRGHAAGTQDPADEVELKKADTRHYIHTYIGTRLG